MGSSVPEFDLLTERWIPVWTMGGASGEVGVLDAIRRAPEFSRIADASPVVTFSLHRLLGAILHQYLLVRDEDEWAEVWSAGRFPSVFLDAVENRCSGRLCLFARDQPFYQSGDIPLSDKATEPLKSVGYLSPESSTGTNIAHFSHADEARHAFCPACCAKGLIHLPCFATAGGAGIKPGVNGVPPLYLLPRGANLFETLMLNFLLPEFRGEMARGDDPGPLWEAGPVVAGKSERSSTGFVESMTWPPRRVRLLPEKGGECSRCGRRCGTLVRRMVFSQGWSRDRALPLWRDAWAAYQRRKKAGEDQPDLIPIRPSEQHDVWRDFPGLFLEHSSDAARPLILDQISSLKGDCLPRNAEITHEVFGLRTDMKAKLFEWRQDSFTFPRALHRSPYAAGTIRQALEQADDAAYAIRSALREIKKSLFEPRDPITGAALRTYWQRMEGEFRRELHHSELMGDQAARAAWLGRWSQAVRRTAVCELDSALENFDGDARQLRSQVEARSRFYAVLKQKNGGKD